MKNRLKRFFNFIKSMKVGITLLILIMLYSMIGTVIPQGMGEQFYSSEYSSTITKFIKLFNLDNLYNSFIFGILFIALTLNLFMCSVIRYKNVMYQLKKKFSTEHMEHVATHNIDSYKSIESEVENSFKKSGFNKFFQDKTNSKVYYSVKNKAGYFGSWFLHFGILLVILFYAYGNITYFSQGVFGVPSTEQFIEGTEYKVHINDFNIDYRSDGSVQQYTTNVDLLNTSGELLKTSNVSVNSPMRYKGYTFYQTGYGWAANCSVLKSGNIISQQLVYEKTILDVSNYDIAIYYNKFYPDFAATAQGFVSLTEQLKNPVVLYTVVYMGQAVKMDIVSIGDAIKWNEYEFIFQEPLRYTYLDVNNMKGQLGAMLGAVLIMLGLILVFYFKPKIMMICVEGSNMFVYQNEPLSKSINMNNQKEKDIYA